MTAARPTQKKRGALMDEEKRTSLGKWIFIGILCLLLIAGGIYFCLTATVTVTGTPTTNGSFVVPSGPPAGASGINGK